MSECSLAEGATVFLGAHTGVHVGSVPTRAAMFTGVMFTLVEILFAEGAGKSLVAPALETSQVVPTGSVDTGPRRTVVGVRLTLFSLPARLTHAVELIEEVLTRGSV